MVQLKRAYKEPSEEDGVRILIDRVWPRGISKEDAQIDIWLKEVAPSKELRKWFGHDPEKWEEFQERYEKEIAPVLPVLKKMIGFVEGERGTVTLVFGAKNQEQNNAVALRSFLE